MGRSAYHRFFEGYTEEKMLGDDGKLHTKRTYRDFLYVPRLTRNQYILRAVCLTGLYLGGAVLLILGAAQRAACNSVWYTAVGLGLSLLCLVIEAIPLFACLTAPRKQTVYQYKAGHRTCVLWARLASGAIALTCLLSLIATVVNHETLGLPLMLLALSCACEATVGIIESTIPYERQQNPNA